MEGKEQDQWTTHLIRKNENDPPKEYAGIYGA
jgi:hypothetical protein